MSSPSGYVALAVGQVEVDLSFSSFQPDDFAFDYHYVENKVDPNPIAIRVTPGVRTTAAGGVTGVKLSLVPAPDSINYILRWGVV